MKKIILILSISALISCKKEKLPPSVLSIKNSVENLHIQDSLSKNKIIHAQHSEKDFYSEIKNYDISGIITASDFHTYDESNEIIQRPEPIGYIGTDYQRFHIHFTRIEKNIKNPYEYTVEGKSMVKNIIRSFKGNLLIIKSELSKTTNLPELRQGFALCKVEFKEDAHLSATGIFKGDLKVGFVLNENKEMQYDGIGFNADSFSNNRFEGNWTSFKTQHSKKVRFGDFRIPDSGDLDIGAGEFSPNPKYWDKGWKYYILSIAGETEKDSDLGKKMEARTWWK